VALGSIEILRHKLNMDDFVHDARSCGWCKKALAAKRRKTSPVGPECENSLPEQCNVALLNLTQHSSEHGHPGTASENAQRAIDNYFGDEIDLVLTFDMWFYNDISEATINAFWNDDGDLKHIHFINPDGGDDLLDEEDRPFYNKEELTLRRRVAMMLDKRTKTKIVVKHIDADWIWFLNGGHYSGPICSRRNPEEVAKENGWDYPIRVCGYCSLMVADYDMIDEAERMTEKIEQQKKQICCCGLGDAIYKKLIDQYDASALRESLDVRMADITRHEWFREHNAGFLGLLEQYTVDGHDYEYPGLVKHEQVGEVFENGGYEIEFDSDLGQDILVNNILPIFLRGLTTGFDEKWNYVVGKLTQQEYGAWKDWMTAVMRPVDFDGPYLLNMSRTVGRLERATVIPILRLDRDPEPPHWQSEFPDLRSMTAKIDTGAKSNTLRVEQLDYKEKSGIQYVAYKLGGEWSPWIEFDRKVVTSSNGFAENRPCILCWFSLGIGDERITHEYAWFTITENTQMRNPILIGRDTLRANRLAVEVWESFKLGRLRD